MVCGWCWVFSLSPWQTTATTRGCGGWLGWALADVSDDGAGRGGCVVWDEPWPTCLTTGRGSCFGVILFGSRGVGVEEGILRSLPLPSPAEEEGVSGGFPSPPSLRRETRGRGCPPEGGSRPPRGGGGFPPEGGRDSVRALLCVSGQGCRVGACSDTVARHFGINGTKWLEPTRAMYKVSGPVPTLSPWPNMSKSTHTMLNLKGSTGIG